MKTNTWEVLNLQIRTLRKPMPHSQNHHIGHIIVTLFLFAAEFSSLHDNKLHP